MRVLILFVLLAGQITPCFPQEPDYRVIFGDAWTKAEKFERENRSWMEATLTENNISYPLAMAVVFPELVRYSALRDKMEITLLKALYINLGEEYANFSIGHFQMKPSFAEQIRDQAPASLKRKSGIRFLKASQYSDISEYRKSIVSDLEKTENQLNYLIAFIMICEKRYRTDHKNDNDIIRILATAYNAGIDLPPDELEAMSNRKFFNTKLFKTENYPYSDVSLFWYREYMSTAK